MKLIHKLSGEFLDTLDPYEDISRYDVEAAYEAGFRKAKELAFKQWEDEDMTSNSLASLGNEEV